MGSGNSNCDGSAAHGARSSRPRSAAIAEVHGVLFGVAWNAERRRAKCEFPARAVGRRRFCAGAGGSRGAAFEWPGGCKKSAETDEQGGAGGNRITAGQRIGGGLFERSASGKSGEHVRRCENS